MKIRQTEQPIVQDHEMKRTLSTLTVEEQHKFLRKRLRRATTSNGWHDQVIGRKFKVQVKRKQQLDKHIGYCIGVIVDWRQFNAVQQKLHKPIVYVLCNLPDNCKLQSHHVHMSY